MDMSDSDRQKFEASTFTASEKTDLMRLHFEESHKIAAEQAALRPDATPERNKHIAEGADLARALLETYTAEVEGKSTGAVIYGIMVTMAAISTSGLRGIQNLALVVGLAQALESVNATAQMQATADRFADLLDPAPKPN